MSKHSVSDVEIGATRSLDGSPSSSSLDVRPVYGVAKHRDTRLKKHVEIESSGLEAYVVQAKFVSLLDALQWDFRVFLSRIRERPRRIKASSHQVASMMHVIIGACA